MRGGGTDGRHTWGLVKNRAKMMKSENYKCIILNPPMFHFAFFCILQSSMQQNEQIMQKGNEALLERLTIAEEDQQEDYEDYGGRRSSRNGAKWSTLPMASWLTLALASSSLLLFRTFCPSYG
jgi:hypothetical protein